MQYFYTSLPKTHETIRIPVGSITHQQPLIMPSLFLLFWSSKTNKQNNGQAPPPRIRWRHFVTLMAPPSPVRHNLRVCRERCFSTAAQKASKCRMDKQMPPAVGSPTKESQCQMCCGEMMWSISKSWFLWESRGNRRLGDFGVWKSIVEPGLTNCDLQNMWYL